MDDDSYWKTRSDGDSLDLSPHTFADTSAGRKRDDAANAPKVHVFHGMDFFHKKPEQSRVESENVSIPNDFSVRQPLVRGWEEKKLETNYPKQRLSTLSMLDKMATTVHCRTVIHDLMTPYRAYIFPGKAFEAPNSKMNVKRPAGDRMISIPWRLVSASGVSMCKNDVGFQYSRGRVVTKSSQKAATAPAYPIKSWNEALDNDSNDRHDPDSGSSFRGLYTAELKASGSMEMMNSSAQPTEEEWSDELAGPFRHVGSNRCTVSVNGLRTFEANLERTIKINQASTTGADQRSSHSPAGFDPRCRTSHASLAASNLTWSSRLTKLRVERRDFRASGCKSSGAVDHFPLDRINDDLARRGERAASSLGFAPNSEVVGMHRKRPPWFINPSLYVKAMT